MLNTLQELLERMSDCARVLEDIIVEEQEAARRFDGDALGDLINRRIEAYQELASLKDDVKALIASSGLSDEMTLETFIDLHTGSDRSRFQPLRRELYERMTRIEKGHADNRIRLHAAYDVSTNVLQHVGMVEQRQTYGPVK